MPMTRRHVARLDQSNFTQARIRKYYSDYFGAQPQCYLSTDGKSAASASSGATNCADSGRTVYEYNLLSAQTINTPIWDAANGLDISGDIVSAHGFEFAAGIGALSTGSFTVGTDRDFYAETQLNLTTANGVSELIFGFRLNQAYQAAATSYTDYATIGLFTSASPGNIQLKTRLASGTAVLQDTTATWASGTTKTFRVVVRFDGSVRFYLNTFDPPVTITNFKFASGSVVNWFCRYLQSATTTAHLYVKYFEQGYLPLRGQV